MEASMTSGLNHLPDLCQRPQARVSVILVLGDILVVIGDHRACRVPRRSLVLLMVSACSGSGLLYRVV